VQHRESVAPPETLIQADPPNRESFLGALGGLITNLPALFSDRVDLLSLELQSAGLALVHLLLWGVTAAMLILTSWLGLWAVLGAAAVHAGMPWPGAVLGVAVINLLAAWAAITAAKRLAPRLGLPMTRRHLDQSGVAPRPDADEAEHHERAR